MLVLIKRMGRDEFDGHQREGLVKINFGGHCSSLEEKLGKLAPAPAVAGLIAPYFVERYKFDKNCLIIQWSGENTNSLAGLTLSSPGDVAISLGTSDTVLGITNEHKPCLEGHIFPNPVDEKGYMVMLFYNNGSLTREDKSWDVFNSCLQETPPLNVGFHRYVIENFNGDSLDGVKEHKVDSFDPTSEVRALVEGQLLSMRVHAERFGLLSPPNRIIAAGGASANKCILTLISSILGAISIQFKAQTRLLWELHLELLMAGCATRKAVLFLYLACTQTNWNRSLYTYCKLAASSGYQKLVTMYALLMKKRMEIENNLVKKLGRL